MYNDTPTENTNYIQYNITWQDNRHVFEKQLGSNGPTVVYHSLYKRLYCKNYTVKVEQNPTFFGKYYAFYKPDGVYIGVQNEA